MPRRYLQRFGSLLGLSILLAAEPAAGGLQPNYFEPRLFVGRANPMVVHGELDGIRVARVEDLRYSLEAPGHHLWVLRLVTRPTVPGELFPFAHEVQFPPLPEGDHRLVVHGVDEATGDLTELEDFPLPVDPAYAIEPSRRVLTDDETFTVAARFRAASGSMPGGYYLLGDRIRVPVAIGCNTECGIPYPLFDYDLVSNPIGPLPAGDYLLEVTYERVFGPLLHQERIRVLPSPVSLQEGRFTVEVQLHPPHGGQAQLAGQPSRDSALFYFFSPDNWEVMLKVLDGCALNGRYWVFGAASTDVGYTVVVRDEQAGTSKQYRHDAGAPAPAITDIDAFPCGADSIGGER